MPGTTAAAAVLLFPVLAAGQEPVKTVDQPGTRLEIGDTAPFPAGVSRTSS